MGFMAKAMEYRKLSEIKKLEGNPRVIRDKEFKTLKRWESFTGEKATLEV